MSPTTEALTVRDVAERLRLSVSRVRELIGSGELPSYTIGRLRRVDPADLAAYLADRKRAPQRVERRTTPKVGNRSWLADLQREAYGHGR